MSRSRKKYSERSCPGGRDCGVCGPKARAQRYALRKVDDMRFAADQIINLPDYLDPCANGACGDCFGGVW